MTHSFFSCQTCMKFLINLCVFFHIISKHEKFPEIGVSHEKKNWFMKKNKADSMKNFNRFMKKIDQIRGFPSSMKKNKQHEKSSWKKNKQYMTFFNSLILPLSQRNRFIYKILRILDRSSAGDKSEVIAKELIRVVLGRNFYWIGKYVE